VARGHEGRRHRFGRRAAGVGVLLCAAASAAMTPGQRSAHALPTRPNILLILTDDQRFDELDRMPIVGSELTGKGVSFPNGLVSDPLCCPSRATILTGTYSHTNGIYTNVNSTGGFAHFRDATTIATVLRTAGYHTGLVGKYLNSYQSKNAGYVPPGWDRWFALTTLKYFDFSVSDQGQLHQYPSSDYQTDVLGQQAVDFVETAPQDEPLFLDWAPFAPHGPAKPAPKYEGVFSGIPPLRPPSYNEADVSDKPAYIQGIPLWDKKAMKNSDRFREHQYECLLSVDEWVGAILAALADTGRLQNTLIVFMGDNGHPLGEHRLGHPGSAKDKASPYEESLKVPFIVRWDEAGWDEPRTDQDHIVANVDLAETFAEAAETTMPGGEGLSLLPILATPGAMWRSDILIEHGVDQRFIPTYCGVRGSPWVYVQYATGEEELYDLASDPFELQNVAGDPVDLDELIQMRQRDHQLCNPVPPGFVWHH
jgi:N-acetylglucosamine-6-sulfatase